MKVKKNISPKRRDLFDVNQGKLKEIIKYMLIL